MCPKTNISLIRRLWITKLRLFDFFNTSYVFRYSHTVSLLPSMTMEQICLLLYSWEENDYQNNSLFPQLENLCVQSNASANHLELFKLLFACCVTILCLKFAINFLRKQKFLLMSEWMEFDLVQSGQKIWNILLKYSSSEVSQQHPCESEYPHWVSRLFSALSLTVAQSPSSKSRVGVYSILSQFSCEIITGFLC